MVNETLPVLSFSSHDDGIGAWRGLETRTLPPPILQRQRQLYRGLDAVAATALGLVERSIGGSEQHFELGAGRAAGHADADGGIDRALLAHDAGALERLAHALGHEHALLQRARQQGGELFAADPARE